MEADPDGNTVIFQLLLLLLFTLMNAFFAGAEMAVVSVNRNRIRSLAEDGNKKARVIQGLFEDSTRFLSRDSGGDHFCGFLFQCVGGFGHRAGSRRMDERTADSLQFGNRTQRRDAAADVF